MVCRSDIVAGSGDRLLRSLFRGRDDVYVQVNGNVGVRARHPDGRLFAAIGFTIANGRIAEMNILADSDRLSRLDFSAIER